MCDPCGKMEIPDPYEIATFVSQKWPLSRVHDRLAGVFPVTAVRCRFLLVSVEHFTSWPIVPPTKRATAETVLQSFKDEILFPVEGPKIIVRNNGICSTA